MPCNYFRPLTSSRLRLYSLLPSPVVVRKQNPSTPFISYTKLPAFVTHRGRFSSICMHGNYCGGPESAPFPFYSASRLPHTLSLLMLEQAAIMEVMHLTIVHIYPPSICPSGNPKIHPSKKKSSIHLHAF